MLPSGQLELSLILFLHFVNDLLYGISNSIHLFVDDYVLCGNILSEQEE